MINHLAQIGSNELRFNLVATDFSQETLDKMEVVKHQMKVSVQIPLLSIYEKKLLNVLPYLNKIEITQLILCSTYIISQTGAEKLQKVLPKTTVITKLTEGKAVIDNQPMLDNIKDHFRNKKYKIPLLIEHPDSNLQLIH
jgi:6-pyruvoyl-tetrahydropterin synthase